MGAIMEVDPFDEPNVTESKDKTKALLAGVKDGKLPPAEPALRSGGLALFAAPDHAQVLRKAAGTLGAATAASAAGWIAAQLPLGDEADSIALLASLPPSDGLHNR